MNDMKLVVNVDAHFDWRLPAESIQDELVRKQADVFAREAAARLQTVFQLLISEFLAAKMDNNNE